MRGTTDDLKGRAKEAVGDMTGDKDLQREGKVDRATGAAKDKVDDAKAWVEDKIDCPPADGSAATADQLRVGDIVVVCEADRWAPRLVRRIAVFDDEHLLVHHWIPGRSVVAQLFRHHQIVRVG